jgi:4-deoxy-L-threo-5-hexosulose-uronate ketol-isomerase
MEKRAVADAVRTARMNAAELRESFLVDKLFVPGELRLVYTFLDRMIVGSVVPTEERIKLTGGKELASDHFAERRELGVLNLGSPGSVVVDGRSIGLSVRDGLYIGRGAKEIAFESARAEDPARFYLASLPAHASYPTTHIPSGNTDPVDLGSAEQANRRTIFKYIHSGGARSCQLVMGITTLAGGSVWNTMPTHTHPRRVEVYLYFDLADDAVVFHYMGQPDESRHVVVRDGQAVLSPSWSIHCGCGTSNYSFAWAMGGENQQFNDLDTVGMDELQ